MCTAEGAAGTPRVSGGRGGAAGPGVLRKELGRYGEAETHYRGAPACLERHEVERLARSGR
ncbi:hypothetical protein AB0K21_09905 [Streptosporangium sp. NPDC049248]|uniref:hypothetical protein n=1 Tax=Streptosporangium sp. NPDC049248 TaxID=3155651 RepID=UPI00343150F4